MRPKADAAVAPPGKPTGGAARQTLADQIHIVLPAEHWDAFLELLDRDEQPVEGLAALFAGPSVENLE